MWVVGSNPAGVTVKMKRKIFKFVEDNRPLLINLMYNVSLPSSDWQFKIAYERVASDYIKKRNEERNKRLDQERTVEN